MYATAWEFVFGKPICDIEPDEQNQSNTCAVFVESDRTDSETCTTPGTVRKTSPKFSPQKHGIYEGTDTDPYTSANVETNSTRMKANFVNPHGTKYDLRHNSKSNCNEDDRY